MHQGKYIFSQLTEFFCNFAKNTLKNEDYY